MTTATKHRDRAHARIYSRWVELPAWREASLAARCLLVEMLARYRPGNIGTLEWSVRRVADILRVSKSTASAVLTELETIGWIEVTRAGSFSRRCVASRYALAMFANDVTGEPATNAFEHWRPDGPRPMATRSRVSKQVRSVRSEVQHSPSRNEFLSVAKDAEPPTKPVAAETKGPVDKPTTGASAPAGSTKLGP
jgi:hypothetical protein